MNSSIGIDFGTTNTVLAMKTADGSVQPVRFPHADAEFSSFRSVLAFWREEGEWLPETHCEAGPWAIEAFIAYPTDTRFFQSFKTYAANRSFQNTQVYGKRYLFEDILAAFFEQVNRRSGDSATLPRRLVLGRPVKFAGPKPDAALAQQRYEAAFKRFGFEEIYHVMEPIAAAYYYAHRQTRASTVLVGDFGGGTSDFSIVSFEPTPSGMHARPLAFSGVGVAGDTFDFRIIDHVVAPVLGKGSKYRSFEKLLDMPQSYYHSFARWSDLCLMRSSGAVAELKRLAAASVEPEKIERFIALIEGNVAYSLYKAVSEAKTRLSRDASARLTFSASGVELDAEIARADFERWIARDLAHLSASIDDALAKAGLAAGAIDRVFLTGGTSFVPAVRRLFTQRFGAEKVDTGDEFVSIANGLALIAEEEDITRWTVDECAAGNGVA
ncbi:Hsp70 family protein [Rhodomicrobium lacus]|uniref:Hsp70 family protein n=1 Tax=Rhodomicrobium lacus TaxID=2498452 RepID=UPI000F8C4760|nr:Hsp70 family protein [Rhodomicrobium lacus]